MQLGHAFHTACLFPWLLKKSTCPDCRSPIPIELLAHVRSQQPLYCLYRAIAAGHTTTALLIIQTLQPEKLIEEMDNGRTILHHAAIFGRDQVIEALLPHFGCENGFHNELKIKILKIEMSSL